MAKYEPKTRPTKESVEAFIAKIPEEERREDCLKLVRMMKKATGKAPRMWGTMVGFGDYHYKYESGHEGDTFQVGFASRKPDLVLYLMCGGTKRDALLARLGKHRTGASCVYIRRLADVDEDVLEKLVAAAARDAKRKAG
jgi:Domain of unknown function (DU1801)